MQLVLLLLITLRIVRVTVSYTRIAIYCPVARFKRYGSGQMIEMIRVDRLCLRQTAVSTNGHAAWRVKEVKGGPEFPFRRSSPIMKRISTCARRGRHQT